MQSVSRFQQPLRKPELRSVSRFRAPGKEVLRLIPSTSFGFRRQSKPFQFCAPPCHTLPSFGGLPYWINSRSDLRLLIFEFAAGEAQFRIRAEPRPPRFTL